MNKNSVLLKLHYFFTRQGFQCQLLHADEVTNYERLNILIKIDSKGRQQFLELRFDTYPLSPFEKEETSKTESLKDREILHLFTALPFFIRPEMSGEVSRLLHMLNKPLDFPGFGLDEVTKLVFYRYSLLTDENDDISNRLLLAIVGMIAFLMESLSPQIEAVAEGATIQEVFSALVNTLTPLK